LKVTEVNIEAMDFSNPNRECDLVMKGGITSGIVYPRIVLKLAGEGNYRFRNVGGTSAGAIAASLMAAAEFGRETGGFHRFYELSQTLAKPGFLFNLFQPSPSLKPLMYTLLELMGKISPEVGLGHETENSIRSESTESNLKSYPTDSKNKSNSLLVQIFRLIGILQRRHQSVAQSGSVWGLLTGSGIALAITVISSFVSYQISANTHSGFSIWIPIILLLVFGIPLGWLGSMLRILVLGAFDLAKRITKDIPQENFFGVCTGRRADGDPKVVDESVLTDWLSSEIDGIAGVKEPLTFGDLQNKRILNNRDGAGAGPDVSINLKMVTSNLSQNQPYTLPFEKGHLFLFNADEFNQLFPPNIVEHLKSKGGQRRELSCKGKQRDFILPSRRSYYFLPESEAMPIVVAMRMSLSFPLLISAVPLYTVKQSVIDGQQNAGKSEYTLDIDTDLQKNWFSDRGISSNFPIHFFDSWLPTRPTFGVNLSADSEDRLANGNTAYLPKVGDMGTPKWIDLDRSLPAFLWQIFATSQNYRDTMQSYLPGYRERIVQIPLTESEGGLNLAMPQSTIDTVMKKGEAAGDRLNGFDFKSHKWIRLRVLIGFLDEKWLYRSCYAKLTAKMPRQQASYSKIVKVPESVSCSFNQF
jgi:predicted acylesterase/phospholipase RssA